MRRKTGILLKAIDKLSEEIGRHTDLFIEERSFLTDPKAPLKILDKSKALEESDLKIGEMTKEIQKLCSSN